MNQQTLGAALETLFERSFVQKVTAQALATGDVDNPAWSALATEVQVQVQQVSAQETVARADDYELRLTHQAFANANSAFVIGGRIVETHRLDETGAWNAVTSGAQTWLILGIAKVRGVPEPWGQVRLDLHLMTAVS